MALRRDRSQAGRRDLTAVFEAGQRLTYDEFHASARLNFWTRLIKACQSLPKPRLIRRALCRRRADGDVDYCLLGAWLHAEQKMMAGMDEIWWQLGISEPDVNRLIALNDEFPGTPEERYAFVLSYLTSQVEWPPA